MVTAHPGLGAVFSANGPIGDGTAQALKGKPGILQLTLDGQPNDVQSIKAGTMSADAVSNAYVEGELTVQYMAAALQGKKVPASALVPLQVIDKANSRQ